jgi:hypothetical protein
MEFINFYLTFIFPKMISKMNAIQKLYMIFCLITLDLFTHSTRYTYAFKAHCHFYKRRKLLYCLLVFDFESK